ncbi:sulfur carrier protein ThiS [Rhodobacteraceae bacterium F11138]|nr:sulfur carrier protein ThiS [Rhodobacteraceae bacterium F11138]
MNIIVNAEPREVASAILSEALDELGFSNPAVATALNGNFVPRQNRQDTRMNEGDRLEVLAPMQGG